MEGLKFLVSIIIVLAGFIIIPLLPVNFTDTQTNLIMLSWLGMSVLLVFGVLTDIKW